MPLVRYGGSIHPSSSDNIDRYVVYNYQQSIWYIGTLARSFWIDRGVFNLPIAAGLDGYLYNHETGFDDGSNNPASGISAYIESSQFDIGEGEQFFFLSVGLYQTSRSATQHLQMRR